MTPRGVGVIALSAGLLLLLSCAHGRPEDSRAADDIARLTGAPDGTDLDDAPLRVTATARVSVSPERAFELVAIDLHEWFPGLEKFAYDHSSTPDGSFAAGSVRVGLYENEKMVERIRRWEAPRFYVYQIDLDATEAWIPIEHHVGIFTVASEADGSVCVTWKQYFDPEIPLTGPIVAWVMSRIAHRAFAELSSRFGEGSPSPRACGR